MPGKRSSCLRLADDAPKGSAVSKVFNKLLDTAQMLAEQLLLFLSCEINVIRIGARSLATGLVVKGARKLARAPLKHAGNRVALVGAGDGWRLGHEIEVEELDKLELDLAGRGARLEERGDSKKAIKALKGTSVSGSVEESGDKGEKSRALDSRAVEGLKEIEEKLYTRYVS